MGFCRQGYWSGLPFPLPGNLPSLGVEPGLLHSQVGSLPTINVTWGSPLVGTLIPFVRAPQWGPNHLLKVPLSNAIILGTKASTYQFRGKHSVHRRRLLRVPWIARRSNQSILKKINPEYSLERLMLKLKLQYFGHLMGRTDSLEKTPMLGQIEGRRRRGRQRMRWSDNVTNAMDMNLGKLGDGGGQGGLLCAVHGITQLGD